tara:strand:+ start:12915 stop:13397 length:483 start_codon:yes stop_codon:yes gene_type:complete
LKLYLVRHANALESSLGDYERALSEKGKNQCIELKNFIVLKEIDLNNKVYCSAAKRTKGTHSLIFNRSKKVSFHKSLYLASSNDLLAFLCSLQSKEDIFLIGHNNGLSDLASYLTGKSVGMKTAACVEIDFPFQNSKFISKGTGEINSYHRCDIGDFHYL